MLRMCFYITRNLTANLCLVTRNLVNLANQVTIYLYWMGFKQSSTNLLFFLHIFLLFAHIFYIYNIHCIIYVCVAHVRITFTHMHIWLRVVPSLSLLPHKRMKQKLPCLALKKGNKNTLGSLVYSWVFFFYFSSACVYNSTSAKTNLQIISKVRNTNTLLNPEPYCCLKPWAISTKVKCRLLSFLWVYAIWIE